MTDAPTIDTYIDAAEARLTKLYGLDRCTDRGLARRMGLSQASVSAWRRGKAFPDDATMQRLAEIADMNVPEALAWLGVWRNTGPVALTYESMARRLGRTAAAFFCAALVGAAALALAPRPAAAAALCTAGTSGEQSVTGRRTLYIMENMGRRLLRWLGRIALLMGLSAASPALAQDRDPAAPAAGASQVVVLSQDPEAGAGAAAWLDAIGSLENTAAATLCTAVLVRADLVATAAHCLEGAAPHHLVLRLGQQRRAVLSVLAEGGHRGGKVTAVSARRDWALLRIVTVSNVVPLPLSPLTTAEIRDAVAEGRATLASAGFGPRHLRAHAPCTIAAPALDAPVGDRILATTCDVEDRDSGGPLVLCEAAACARPFLIALNVGAGRHAALATAVVNFAHLIGSNP